MQNVVDPKLSSKILSLAKSQQLELEREQNLLNVLDDDNDVDENVDDEIIEEELIENDENPYDQDEFNELDIDPNDQNVLNKFLPESNSNRKTLADLILEKIDQSGQQQSKNEIPGVNQKVIEVYSKVGELMSRYRSGPLPKAFKIIPSLPNWIAILQLTGPDSWTPHATYAATRLFASNLKAHQSRLFYEHVLLDRCRDNLNDPNNKKMDVHLYDALRKALYKPAAFFKGVLFPLCQVSFHS